MNTSTPDVPVPEAVVFSSGDTGFVLLCGALVFLMTPGLAYFYAGMSHAKNTLSVLIMTILAIAVVTMQWYLFGFSIALSASSSTFIGGCDQCCLVNSLGRAHVLAPTIPVLAYWFFMLTFAIITPALAFGAAAGRLRPGPFCVFVFLWTTLVYDFVAYWIWSPNGWLKDGGSVDFAGGTAVHITSGFAGLALALNMPRKKKGEEHGNKHFHPHNISYVLLGTSLLWFGWFGFNGGSEVAADERAALAFVNSVIAGSFGGLCWVICDLFKSRRLSVLGFCSGSVAGLVVITPGSGFVNPWGAVIIGVLAGFVCCLAVEITVIFRLDDVCDVFGVHGIGGVLGCFLTGIFTSKPTLDAVGAAPLKYYGVIDGEGFLLAWNIAALLSAAVWSFVMTFLLIWLMWIIPPLRLQARPHAVAKGIDSTHLGDHPDAPPVKMNFLTVKNWMLGRDVCAAEDAANFHMWQNGHYDEGWDTPSLEGLAKQVAMLQQTVTAMQTGSWNPALNSQMVAMTIPHYRTATIFPAVPPPAPVYVPTLLPPTTMVL